LFRGNGFEVLTNCISSTNFVHQEALNSQASTIAENVTPLEKELIEIKQCNVANQISIGRIPDMKCVTMRQICNLVV
jgi:hypothetical protein